jgi:hypothetical protein
VLAIIPFQPPYLSFFSSFLLFLQNFVLLLLYYLSFALATCFFYRVLSEDYLLPCGLCSAFQSAKLYWIHEKGNKVRKERRQTLHITSNQITHSPSGLITISCVDIFLLIIRQRLVHILSVSFLIYLALFNWNSLVLIHCRLLSAPSSSLPIARNSHNQTKPSSLSLSLKLKRFSLHNQPPRQLNHKFSTSQPGL